MFLFAITWLVICFYMIRQGYDNDITFNITTIAVAKKLDITIIVVAVTIMIHINIIVSLWLYNYTSPSLLLWPQMYSHQHNDLTKMDRE